MNGSAKWRAVLYVRVLPLLDRSRKSWTVKLYIVTEGCAEFELHTIQVSTAVDRVTLPVALL